jgi:aromatic-amino-acid transaminase
MSFFALPWSIETPSAGGVWPAFMELQRKQGVKMILNDLTMLPDDPILGLMDLYLRDTRAGKVDLGVGIYKDVNGTAPVMTAVKQAEAWLLATQRSKAYTPTSGAAGFNEALGELVFGPGLGQFAQGVQTPGGTGAVRLAAEFGRRANVPAILIGTPTWAIHNSIFASASIVTASYQQLDGQGAFNLAGLLCGLSTLARGDMVLLQASCHNPTGIDPSAQQWQTILEQVRDKGLIPVFDLAYQGFGDGLEQDAYAVRLFAEQLPLVLVAVSCSKNFGLYCERTGSLFVAGTRQAHLPAVKSHLVDLARCIWSMPPAHGAQVVSLILRSAELSVAWRSELEQMRMRIVSLRGSLVHALQSVGVTQFAQLPQQRGMFSNLDCSAARVSSLRSEHAIYAVGRGRLNVSGLTPDSALAVATALRDTLGA